MGESPGPGDPEWGVISGAEASGYTPTAPYDVGKRLRVVMTYTDGTGTARGATSPATNRVDQRGVVGLSTSVPDVGIEVIATLADADEGVTDAVLAVAAFAERRDTLMERYNRR